MKIYSVISDDPLYGLGLEGTYEDRIDADLHAACVKATKKIPVIVIASEVRHRSELARKTKTPTPRVPPEEI